MRDKNRRPPAVTDKLITDALALGFQDAVDEHRRLGLPLVVWRDGKIAHVYADEIPPEELPRNAKKGGKRNARES